MGLGLSVLASALFAGMAFTDLAGRRIPNRLVIALAAVAVLRIGLGQFAGAGLAAPAADVAASLAVFLFGALIFHFHLLGGGDVKLLAAGALWVGAPSIAGYLMLTAMVGGGLAIAFLVFKAVAGRGADARAKSLPYGVAIAAAGILTTAARF